jgi:hypothetical protein
MEAKSVAGEDINLELFGTLTDRLGRTLQRLELRRVPKVIGPLICRNIFATARMVHARMPQDRCLMASTGTKVMTASISISAAKPVLLVAENVAPIGQLSIASPR